MAPVGGWVGYSVEGNSRTHSQQAGGRGVRTVVVQNVLVLRDIGGDSKERAIRKVIRGEG